MGNELTVNDRLTEVEVRAQVNLIQKVMKKVMKKDTHFGTIPGCQKPTLYKAGAEVLATTFKLAVEPEVDDLSTEDEIRYRVKVRLTSISNGNFVGVGIGECSTNEEKYKWRKAVCEKEWEATDELRRREVWKKGKGGSEYSIKQVRTNVADLANTVLKMAKKRGQVDAILTATSASDIFTQDVEDLPEEIREGMETAQPQSTKPDVEMPKEKNGDNTTTEPVISDKQGKRLFAIAKAMGYSNDDMKAWVKDKYWHEHLRDILVVEYDEIVEHFQIKKGA